MDTSASLLVALTLFTLWCTLHWRSRRKLWAAARLIPGPKPLPVIGNVFYFWTKNKQPLPRILKLRSDFGKVARIWIFGQLVVVICDPEDIKRVLGSTKITDRDRNLSLALKPFLGTSLFTTSGEMWKSRRKLMTPMFNFSVLQSYLGVFGAKAKILADKLDEVADGKTINVHEKINLCAVDGSCETLIGVSSNTQENAFVDYQDAHYTIGKLVLRRMVFRWLLVPWLYPRTSDGRKADDVMKIIDGFLTTKSDPAERSLSDIISQKLAAFRKGGGLVGTSFLDLLIEASETQGSVFTETDLLDEVRTMIAASSLTVGNTISNLLMLIAIHPKWQDALYTEMTDVFADDFTRPVATLDIPNMPVLDRVIRETLRLFPIIGMLPREITEEVTLPSGYTLPSGSSAVVITYLVHRDPENYPKPDEFLPDRWLPGSGSSEHFYAYLPFSAGPRNCIGHKYSVFQIKSTVSLLVRRFKMTTNRTMKDLAKIEMQPSLKLGLETYQLRLKKRDVV